MTMLLTAIGVFGPAFIGYGLGSTLYYFTWRIKLTCYALALAAYFCGIAAGICSVQ